MEDWQRVRAFGIAARRSIVRPSVYGLILNNAGQLAIVRSANGTFLPGGGIDKGETPEEALRREALEECGFHVRIGSFVNRAIQFVGAASRKKCVEKRSEFFEAEIESTDVEQMEPGHETVWVNPQDAAKYLTHPSHVWIVSQWRSIEK